MSKNVEYEISGIDNVNRILPKNGSWYYKYLKNGNLKVYGKPIHRDAFFSTEFEQNIRNHDGIIQKKNNLTNLKKVNMSNEQPKQNGESTDEGKTSIQELQAIEQQIETFLENQDEAPIETSVESTWSTIVLTTNTDVTDSTVLSTQLQNHLETKIDKEAQSKIKPLLEKIKKGLKKGKITSAVYTQPKCNPSVEGKNITIAKSDSTSATLEVTVEEPVDTVKVTSVKTHTIAANLFSSEVVMGALSEFSDGKTFLKGLTEYKETFVPNS